MKTRTKLANAEYIWNVTVWARLGISYFWWKTSLPRIVLSLSLTHSPSPFSWLKNNRPRLTLHNWLIQLLRRFSSLARGIPPASSVALAYFHNAQRRVWAERTPHSKVWRVYCMAEACGMRNSREGSGTPHSWNIHFGIFPCAKVLRECKKRGYAQKRRWCHWWKITLKC